MFHADNVLGQPLPYTAIIYAVVFLERKVFL
ncbi:hypothetical protein [Enterococcus phage MDA2]|uniref:Uncharacterized protein n=1 Tax=Enterococcus phage MDA2 TaxID=2816459 RepID=A0AAE7UVQ7_9CAUD|nr:hypothetical protein [Enterococcus phage MDA2]